MLKTTSSPQSAGKQGTDPYRVMVVDDSAVIRGLLSRALEQDPDIRIVASVANGQLAVNQVQRQPIDVVVLDIEMPVMDGLTALPKILAASPKTKVIMASTLTKRNAEISLRAMSLGAADYVPKPSATRDIHSGDDFRRELLDKVKTFAAQAVAAGGSERRQAVSARPLPNRPTPGSLKPAGAGKIALRPMPSRFDPRLIAIGSSTGGPQALFEVVSALKGMSMPIVITQHMPATFTTILAEHITRQCGVPTTEAKDGDILTAGHAYVAPGNYHMVVASDGGRLVLRTNQQPAENFCRPAVDPMMRSIVAAVGGRVLALILTGMGQDGMKGCREVAAAGGVLIAQDEATSVVWGMPGAVAGDGTCNAVLPLKEIGPHLRKLAMRSAA